MSSALLAVFLPGAGGDVVLKGMDELVADDVIGVLERRPEGQDDAALARFGDAARALAHHLAEDGRLLELGMAGVHDERLLAPQVVVEQAGVAFVPPLGHLAGDLDGLFLFGIVIDVEMLGLEHPVIEFLPLDLVPAEILAEGGRQADARPRRGQDDAQDQAGPGAVTSGIAHRGPPRRTAQGLFRLVLICTHSHRICQLARTFFAGSAKNHQETGQLSSPGRSG